MYSGFPENGSPVPPPVRADEALQNRQLARITIAILEAQTAGPGKARRPRALEDGRCMGECGDDLAPGIRIP